MHAKEGVGGTIIGWGAACENNRRPRERWSGVVSVSFPGRDTWLWLATNERTTAGGELVSSRTRPVTLGAKPWTTPSHFRENQGSRVYQNEARFIVSAKKKKHTQ